MGCDEGEDAQPQAAWELKTAPWCCELCLHSASTASAELGRGWRCSGNVQRSDILRRKRPETEEGILWHVHVWYQYGSLRNC